jgi:hypothetical protein
MSDFEIPKRCERSRKVEGLKQVEEEQGSDELR